MLLGYARVSTEDQNLDLQISALTAAGVDATRIYQDKASGATTRRPGYQTLLRHARTGDVICVWKLDRLGRNLGELVKVVDEMGKRGVDVRSLTEPFDTSTAIGKMLFSICGAFAEFERNLISERTKAGLVAARARGSQVGRKSAITDEVRERALQLVATGAAKNAGELRDLLGLKKPTFHANFRGGFEELRRQAKGLKRRNMRET